MKNGLEKGDKPQCNMEKENGEQEMHIITGYRLYFQYSNSGKIERAGIYQDLEHIKSEIQSLNTQFQNHISIHHWMEEELTSINNPKLIKTPTISPDILIDAKKTYKQISKRIIKQLFINPTDDEKNWERLEQDLAQKLIEINPYISSIPSFYLFFHQSCREAIKEVINEKTN